MRFRHAATLCLVRDGPSGLEVLLGKRSNRARFVAGAHVFPGGVVDDIDGAALALRLTGGVRDPWRMAAIRETYEEVGILVGASHAVEVLGHDAQFYRDLVASGASIDLSAVSYLSTWITPPGFPFRYDTRFFVAAAHQDPMVDGQEFVEAAWARPSSALELMRRGEWVLVSPTTAHLDFLDQFACVDELFDGIESQHGFERIDQFFVEGRRPDGLEMAP